MNAVIHQLGYVLHRVNDSQVPHGSGWYRRLDRLATKLYNW